MGVGPASPNPHGAIVPHLFRSHLSRMKPRVTFSEDLADRIMEGLMDGRGLRLICREPGMPTRANVMRWLAARADLADFAAFARQWGGIDGTGRPSGFCEDLSDRIFDRLCTGEPLRTLCGDPSMPSRSTVHTWMRRDPEFARAVALARDLAAWAAAERKWIAMGH